MVSLEYLIAKRLICNTWNVQKTLQIGDIQGDFEPRQSNTGALNI